MKKYTLFLALIFIFSCRKDKVILLPEISHSGITEIQDVSAAYIFYDETKPDSTELNRRNLISTTNWLINVDKRLTLKQAIPHIKFLQEKKGNSSHKNENAKNYFTCNDTSRKSLGFIEFTDVVYIKKRIINVLANNSISNDKLIVHFASPKNIKINSFFEKISITHSNISELNYNIMSLSNNNDNFKIELCFDENITFKDYILFKSVLSELKNEAILTSEEEFITN